MNEQQGTHSDELFQSFLQATEATESQRLMACLITECADPVIKEIITYKLGASPAGAGEAQESEDVYHNVLTSLLKRLRAAKLQPDGQPIHNFRGYVATITYNACANLLREKYPRRHLLKNRLRYFLTHEAGFALWQSGQRDWLGGLAAWQAENRPPVAASLLQPLRENFRQALTSNYLLEDLNRSKLKELLTSLFDRLEGPVDIDELVKLIAEVCGLRDQAAAQSRPEEMALSADELLPAAVTDIETEYERRAYLQRLWAEICQLPASQGAALLLNLKDAQGGCGLALFPLTGTADFRQLAEALRLSAEELGRLWNELPLDDLSIAGRLGITRQQVINLRKSARQRLSRRLKGY
jgi:DNA-directed RNA polymerase specialized sigma24 family protein